MSMLLIWWILVIFQILFFFPCYHSSTFLQEQPINAVPLKKPVINTPAVSSSGGLFSFDRASFDVSYLTHNTVDGEQIAMPWISSHTDSSAQPSLMPVCYNQTPNNLQDAPVIRLAHVLCRQAGFMIATKWLAISKEMVATNTTGVVGFCRGDEQVVAHCQWYKSAGCSHFLAIECGECSNSYILTEDSRVVLISPGFPVYLPLVTCEWNITLLPDHNLVIKFQEFELLSPVYDEAINTITCVTAAVEVMLWHEDINKMAVYGRYCGRYNPGNKVVSSNRVLIRFTSGSYKPDVFSKKGFIAELSSSSSIVPSSSSGSILIVRWTLIGCAIFFAAGVVIFLWFWKGRFEQLRQRCCCCCSMCTWPEEYNSSVEEEHSDHLSSIHPQDVVRQTSTARMISGGVHQRRHETKPSDPEECDIKHWEQTKRLEKWHSTQHKNRSSSWAGLNNNKIDRSSKLTKDDSHSYEEVCCNRQINCQQKGVAKDDSHIYETIYYGQPNARKESLKSPPSSAPPFAIIYNHDPLFIPYLPLSGPGDIPLLSLPPRPRIPLQFNSSSASTRPPSYIFPSDTSCGQSCFSPPSALYVNPEPDPYSSDDD